MKYTAIIVMFILFSCNMRSNETYNNFNLKLKVNNETNAKIDSITIYCNGYKKNIKYFSLKPNESKDFILDMSNVSKVDGHYRIDYQLQNSKGMKSNHFGYYTNGSPLEELIEIRIENDTILFEYKTIF